MTAIVIPRTIEDAKASLDGLGQLLTAKEWERAAIVYAFTRDGINQYDAASVSMQQSVRQFASLGITGLNTQNAVRAYRSAWKSAMEDGAPDVKPGDTIEVPNLPWKSVFGEATPDVQARVTKQVLRDPEKFAKLVADPEVADLVAEAVVNAPATRWRVERDLVKDRPPAPVLLHPDRPARSAAEEVVKAIQSFFDTTLPYNGALLSYRDVIRAVAEAGDARELYRLSIVPTPLGPVLRDALAGMAVEATTLADLFLIDRDALKEVEA